MRQETDPEEPAQLEEEELKLASPLLMFTASDAFHEAMCASVDKVRILTGGGMRACGSMSEK
jgi:hypothetical protein